MSLTEPVDDGAHAGGDPARRSLGRSVVLVGTRDGGVSARLIRRCRIAASGLLVLGCCLLLFAILRPWGLAAAVGTLLAAALLAGAGVLAVRARLWNVVAGIPIEWGSGRTATIGEPRPLSPTRPGAPLKRKLGATVVPIRAATGPQPGAGALVVHGRADGEVLAGGDTVSYSWVAGGEKSTKGRFVLCRQRDGAVFLATTRLSDTW